MSRVPAITARELLAVLRRLGFVEVRSRGSHRRLAHPDGRRTTVAVHSGRDVPRGLLQKIVTEDVGLTMEEFVRAL
ncbi:MAG: type II toxin-antitoxin system HicA family toxin [Phycisphaerales bacterium]